MNRCFRDTSSVCVFLGGACLIVSPFVQAYEFTLTPAAIHEAYIIGRRSDQATAGLLTSYIWGCPPPEASCSITQIELFTPFAQIVDLSQRNATKDYTEHQAADDYRRHRDKVVVQITLILLVAYKAAQRNSGQNLPAKDAPRPENFWQNFRFSLKQHGKAIPSRSLRNKPFIPRQRRTRLPCWTAPMFRLTTTRRMLPRKKPRWRFSLRSPKLSQLPLI